MEELGIITSDISLYLFAILLLTSCLLIFFALFAIFRRGAKGTLVYAGFCISSSIYTLFYGFELISPTIETALFWSNLQYLGIAALPVWSLLFSLEYLGYSRFRKDKKALLLWVLPLLIVIAKFTDVHHGLIYQNVELVFHKGILLLDITPGIGYWANMAYMNIALLLSFLLLLSGLRIAKRKRVKTQLSVLLIGYFAPWVAHLLYQVNLSPLGMDIAPFGFLFTSICLGYILFKHDLFNIGTVIYDHVFEGMRDGVILTDHDNNILEANNAAKRLFGREGKTITGKQVSVLFDNNRELMELFQGDLEDLLFYKRVNNKRHSFLVKKSAVLDGEHNLVGKVFFFNDITELTDTELKLKAKSRELDNYFSNSLDLLCVIDQTGVFVHVNPVWKTVMGYKPAELEGNNLRAYVHKQDIDRFEEILSEKSPVNEVYTFLTRFYASLDNSYHWLEWSVNKTDNLIYATLRDISKRMSEQQALKKIIAYSEEFLVMRTTDLDFQQVCDRFREISMARMVLLNFFTESKDITVTGFSASEDDYKEINTIFQHPLVGSSWQFPKKKQESEYSNQIKRYSNFGELASGILPEDKVSRIDNLLSDGEIYVANIRIENRVVGAFIYQCRSEPMVDNDILELFTKQVGLLIARKKEEDVRASERAYFENLFESSPAGIVLLNDLDHVIRCNEEFLEIFGYHDYEVIGQPINDLIVPENLKDEGLSLTTDVSEGRSIRHDTVRRKKDGTLVNVSILGKPMKLPTGEHVVYGIYIDITEQIRIKNTLKDQQFQLEQALGLQQVISEVALELNSPKEFEIRMNNVLSIIGKNMDVSRAYIFENSSDQSITTNTHEWCASGVESQIKKMQNLRYDSVPGLKDELMSKGFVVAESMTEQNISVRALLEAQDIKSVVLGSIYVADSFFGFLGFDECRRPKVWNLAELQMIQALSAIISNAYERRMIEISLLEERDKANHANIAKSEFLANISHEIRTPMNAILGFSEALYEQLDEPDYKNMLSSVLSSGRSLLSLLNDILDLSKIESGKIEIKHYPFDLFRLIEEIVVLFRNKTSRKGIEIFFHKPEVFPARIVLDEIRVKQVLFNLIGNAVKFTHEGFVDIRLEIHYQDKRSGNLFIHIRDTGIGIPEAQHEIIFDSFKQASQRPDKRYEGTGLGLSISKRLIERMNGNILLESKEGTGSVFTVVFYNVQFDHQSSDDKSVIEKEVDIEFERSTVLIVDDLDVNIMLVQGMLETMGIDTRAVSNGIQAIDILSEYKFDLVILDLRMPGMNGFEVAERIRSNPKLAHIPVLAYTAAIVELKLREDLQIFDGYLFKPINRKDLEAELKRFLKYSKKPVNLTSEIVEETPFSKTLSKLEGQQLQTLTGMLKDIFLPQWKELKDQFVLYKIETFAVQLKEVAISFNFAYLENYAKRLIEATESFDTDKIQDVLMVFPEIIANIDN